MRRGLAALAVAGATAAALVPTGAPASAAGTDWVGLLEREIATSVDAGGLPAVLRGSRDDRGARVEPAEEPVELPGGPGGVYGQDCISPAASPLALRRATVTVDAGGARFTAEGCREWTAADLADGAVAWRVAAPGGSGDADYTVAVVGDDLDAVVTVAGGGTSFTGRGGLGADGALSVTIPPETIGDHTEFGLVVASFDGAGGGDALTGRDGRPLLYPTTPETAVVGAVTVTADPGAFEDAVAAAETAGFSVTTPVPEIRAFGVEAVGPEDLRDLRTLSGVAEVRPATAAGVTTTPTAAYYGHQWALDRIDAPRAWRKRTGSGLTVAVVDSGVDGTRPDLGDRVLAGRDTWTGQRFPAGANSDLNDHGTAVAGIIAADGHHDVAGVDWTARILPYRFTDENGNGPVLAVASAIVRAADAGADVVNLSLGTVTDEPALADAVRYAVSRGVVLVAASGNTAREGNPTMYPAAYREVIAVGATTPSGTPASYSNTGSHLHLVAPGGEGGSGSVERDVLVLGRGLGRDPDLLVLAGTSFAAPHVAGAASLYLAGHPAASPTAVAAALADTAVDAGPTGRDPAYGHGRLDLGTLVSRAPRVDAATARACPPADVVRPEFRDVFRSSHYEAIACLSWWQLTGGTTPDTYAPAAEVHRGQMATFLIRLLGEADVDVPPPTNQGFADVAGSAHADAINQAAALGVARGRSATRFAPRAPVTREQMATFLARAHEVATGRRLPVATGVEFADIADSRHREGILALASAGVVSGTAPTTYSPKGAVTRAQMGSFLMRAASLLVEGAHAAPPTR